MKPISIDDLPDFVSKEFPEMGLECVVDFAREAIAIRNDSGHEIAAFKEAAFEDEKVSEEMVREKIKNWKKK